MNGRRQWGFSLLEMLVTLFVIVLVTSMVTLNITSSGRDIELQATVDDMAGTAAYALDEAQFVGRDFGLLLTLQSEGMEQRYHYSWRERGESRWGEPGSGKDVFAGGQLPVDVELELELDGVLQDQEIFAVIEEDAAPQLVFYASGETTPGALDIRSRESGDLLWRIQWDLLGNFLPLSRGEAEED